MIYRRLGKHDFEVSILSLGIRYSSLTNEGEFIKMVKYAVEHGVNYIDIGYPYDFKRHEALLRAVCKAIQGIRGKVKIAVTLPCAYVNSLEDLDRYLDMQLRLLEVDKADFCVLGDLNRENWPKMQKLDALSWVKKTVSNGRFEGAGFSFHDDFRFLGDIITAYDGWIFSQFQYNYIDVDHPGVNGIRYAAEKGLGVIVTQPLKGGRLAKPPEPILKIWENAQQSRSPAEWGLLWAWNHPEVSTVVVGVKDAKHVANNIAMTDIAKPDSLTVQELLMFNQVREAYLKLRPVNCAGCRCCMPCPIEIDVPRILELYNDAFIYDDVETARFYYVYERHKAENCTECGECVHKCPRKIEIIDWLKKAHQLLASH